MQHTFLNATKYRRWEESRLRHSSVIWKRFIQSHHKEIRQKWETDRCSSKGVPSLFPGFLLLFIINLALNRARSNNPKCYRKRLQQLYTPNDHTVTTTQSHIIKPHTATQNYRLTVPRRLYVSKSIVSRVVDRCRCPNQHKKSEEIGEESDGDDLCPVLPCPLVFLLVIVCQLLLHTYIHTRTYIQFYGVLTYACKTSRVLGQHKWWASWPS